MNLRFPTARALGLAAGLAAAPACVSELPVPEITAVRPAWAWNGEATVVTLSGEGFYPAYSVVARDGAEANIDDRFEVRLEGPRDLDLDEVALIDYQTLSVQVPAGLPVGDYELVLDTPSHRSARWDGVFEVSDTLAYAMSFSTDEDSFLVSQPAQLSFQLVDPDGEPVDQALAVAITADTQQEVFTGAAELGEPSVDGNTLLGVLRDDGSGSVNVSAEVAEDIWFTVGPQDPDSRVLPASFLVSFEPSEIASVDVVLPYEGFVATAGRPFEVGVVLRDNFGNPLPDVSLELALVETCDFGSLVAKPLSVIGSQTVEVAVTGATGPDCEANQILVLASAASVQDSASEPFQTLPGPLSGFEVSASSESVTAGEPGFVVRVRPVDSYGNTVPDYGGGMIFRDDIGGLDSLADPSAVDCGEPFGGTGEVDCEVRLTRAAEAVTISVTDAETGLITGSVGPIEVSAGLPDRVAVSPESIGTDADSAYTVLVDVYDAYDNPAPITVGGDYAISAGDLSGGTSCGSALEIAPGNLKMSCLSRVAGEQVLGVDLLPQIGGLPSLSGQTTVNVVNGQLARLNLLASVNEITAGEDFELSVAATDAWDNPYTVQHTGSAISLEDSTGTLSPGSLSLDADGLASGSFTLLRAGEDVAVDAWHRGDYIESVSLRVLPGSLDHLTLTPERRYTWLDEPLTVELSARDSWENVVTDYSDPVELVSEGAGFADLTVAALVDGVAELELTWTAAIRQDQVIATGLGGETGASPRIDALDPSCDDGPAAELAINGLSEGAITCMAGDSSAATATLDAAAGSAALAAYHISLGELESERVSAEGGAVSYSLEVGQPGAYTVELVALDLSACGSSQRATWWVGEDDGSPAGPIAISVDDDSLVVGDAASVTGVSLSLEDCNGDPASPGSELLVRTDRGELSGLTASGAGLVASVVAPGRAELDFDASAEDRGGVATIAAGLASGAAYGEAEVTLTGDNARPYVTAVDPSGDVSGGGAIDWISVSLSEPLLPTMVLTDGEQLRLDGPDGAVALTGISHQGGVIDIEVDDLDPAAGEYLLTLEGSTRGSSLVDVSGNRLDGSYSGAAGDYQVRFGTTTDEGLELTACAASSPSFTPDGDDGAGEEADAITLDVAASGSPSWWQLSVVDGAGQTLYSWRTAAVADSETLSWDGRDYGGAIVGEGSYSARIRSVDAGDNLSAACTVDFELAQHFRGPE